MSDLRQAAQQAIGLICSARLCEINSMSSRQEMLRLMIEATDVLRAALAEPVECQHGVTDGNCKECYEAKAEPVQEPVAYCSFGEWVYLTRVVPSPDKIPLYAAPPRCPNCASLEEQNTELDRKLAELTEAVLRANGIGGK